MKNFSKELENLRLSADKTSKFIDEGIAWLNKYGDSTLRLSKIGILDDNKRMIERVVRASEKRPSIAIFGQSQVGKSYLVRTLAQSPSNAKLEVVNNSTGVNIDFLQRINPPGGRESTGIITRFSTRNVETVNEDFSFKLELLKQLDIASIIINGYLEDLKDYQDDFDNEEVLDAIINTKLQDKAFDDISKYDVLDFKDYLLKHFKDDYRIRDCRSIGYFDMLIEKLPFISHDERWQILHFLWGKNPFLTELFKLLSEALNILNFSDTVFVDEEAVVNDIQLSQQFSGSSNILDVERVKEAFNQKQLPDLKVCLSNGEVKSVNRSVLCALIKELHFEIPDSFEENEERGFLNHSDLLDFPGSKTRDQIPENVFNDNSEAEKLSLFVRGKVSYLFYLYNRDIGISTLLYCMDNEPPLVAESPALLENWISQYIGNSPEKRKDHLNNVLTLFEEQGLQFEVKQVSPLLIAMTKFNIELAGKGDADIKGEPGSHDSKWFARFQENFSNYMSRPVEDKWTENWTNQEVPFQFLFPIRDPNFSTAIFDGYEVNGQESIVRPERVGKLDDMKTSFMKSTVVDKFIIQRKEIWEELTSPNRTGLSYLCKYLAPSAHPANLLAQLQTILNNATERILDTLEAEYFSGDMDEDLKQARLKGAEAFAAVIALNSTSSKTLSAILDKLSTSEIEIWSLLFEFKSKGGMDEEAAQNDVDTTELKIFLNGLGIQFDDREGLENIKIQLLEFFGVNEDELNEILSEQIGYSLKDLTSVLAKPSGKSEEFVTKVIENWSAKLSTALTDDAISGLYINEKNRAALQVAIAEIIKSPNLKRVREHIDSIVKDELKRAFTSNQLEFIASCISSILNKFTYSVGWAFEDENQKPALRNNGNIFKNQGVLVDPKVLEEAQTILGKGKYVQELATGVKELFQHNVKLNYGLDEKFDSEANNKIAAIIKGIKES